MQTYDEAIAAVNALKAKDNNLQKYQLGTGYDVLTGSRSAICMDPNTLGTTVTARNETADTYNIAHSYSDLYSKLETEFGADIGGIYQIFTGSLSVKTKIMQETHVTTDDVVIIAGFTYVKDRVSVGNTGADYAEYFRSLSQKNRTLFRKYCGDRFTKDVSTGAMMYMVFTAKKLDSTQHDQSSVDAAIKIGLAGILNFGASTSISKEQKAILNSYSFSTKCYSTGTSIDVCGGFSSTTAFDINTDTSSIQKKIADSHQKMLDEVRAGNNLTVIKETLLDYDVPVSACTLDGNSPCPSRWSYFVDYRDRLSKLKTMSVQREESDDVCSKISYMPHRCTRVAELFDNAINACRGFDSSCDIPNDNEYRTILSAENPGWVEMWDNSQYGGSYWSIDFRNFLAGSPYAPYNLYVFKNIGIGKANDKITSFKTHLANNWTIKWYHDTDPKNPGKHYDVTGSQDVGNVGKDNNDKFSSFLLLPPGDL